MLYGTASGDQFGTPWARILLGFRCFASMPHGCVHRPRPPAMRLCPPSCPPRAYYMHAFALFLRVWKMLYGTASGDQFGTPWARILLGFRCFASMPHGCVHRPCPPTTSLYDLSSYPPCAYLSMLLAVFFTGFQVAVRHRVWGSIWHALGSNSAGVPLFRKHASRMRSSAMSAYTRRYVHLYPP